MKLGIEGFIYADLYRPERLADLMESFDTALQDSDPSLYAEFNAYRDSQGDDMAPQDISDLLVRLAPHVGEFLARLFHVENERNTQMAAIQEDVDIIFTFRNEITARLPSLFKNHALDDLDIRQTADQLELLIQAGFPEADKDTDRERRVCLVGSYLARLSNHYRSVAKGKGSVIHNADSAVIEIREALAAHAEAKQDFADMLALLDMGRFVDALLTIVQRWAFAAVHDPELNKRIRGWVSFKMPQKTDQDNLVHHETRHRQGYETWVGFPAEHRRRDGFSLTDHRFNQRQVQYEIDHCIYCHDRDTDSCSKGMRNKRGGDKDFKVNALGVTITGCPLGEKISEMHVIKRQGDNIGSLALVTLDNPMCPGTGHRICNDCMRGCIYQKTEPVNIPQIETNVLTDVLFMPWGFEIYSLLTRWNPLNVERPYALPYNGK
ncbi:MAG TPA: pyridine nucleotide-disulfide oxidoreductase, partial [Gammaproteobacteria bacterium]|nr:pyridine nucleotide-disulfide oxidoreductase [Gammaproteobacteria bacterium]